MAAAPGTSRVGPEGRRHVNLAEWGERKLWPDVRGGFLAACAAKGYEESDSPWTLFAAWWRAEERRRKEAEAEAARVAARHALDARRRR